MMVSEVCGLNDEQRFLDVNEEPDKVLTLLPTPVNRGKEMLSISSFHMRCNGALRDVDHTKAAPLCDYYKLLMSALNKYSSTQDDVWRAVTSRIDELSVIGAFLDKKKH
ncbi:unnamed protein product [Rotaria sp. Silwood1]|nr:unnamed protein product [Rotaria sp. Silwood1]CAF4858734.1 unnamed protein product [Rotaria sp. Silwood1]